MLENLRDPKDLFKKVCATKGRQAKGVCALRVGDQHTAELEVQAELLGKTFFPATRTQPCSLTTDFDLEQQEARAWRQFTKDKLKSAVLGTSNSLAAGLLGLSYCTVKWIIKVAGAQLLNLYNACMRMRCHPTCWKQELMAVVPKPRKADMSSLKSYCPISLIECLSKVLKKMVATRMQIDIAVHGLLPNNQFGGLHHVGTNDAGLALVHNIETTWNNKQFCAVIAADIAQFFLSLNHARLIQVCGLLGYPPEITRWLGSFLLDSSFAFWIGGQTTKCMPFHRCGVPQGSPLLPVLAATYIAAATDVEGCQVYVDNAALKGFGPTAKGALNEALMLCSKVEGCLNAIGLQINHRDKLEAIIFSRKAFSTATICVAHPDSTETIVPVGQVWCYLGFYFTTKLCWKEHMKQCKLKAIAATQALHILANCVKGHTLAHTQTAYLMGICPVITYRAPIWFSGRHQEGLIKELETAQNKGVRWCLSTFQTSNIEAMRHIALILPIRYVLGQLQENCLTCLWAVGPNHGLVTRLAKRRRLRCCKATTLANLKALSADVAEQIDPAHKAARDVPMGLC
jgi:hypothetical protein